MILNIHKMDTYTHIKKVVKGGKRRAKTNNVDTEMGGHRWHSGFSLSLSLFLSLTFMISFFLFLLGGNK